ncbi:TonB-dependent receptor [Veillonellaceae bacterium M2-4]|nr:TonB-dependent receptor [Veillonellaceae bacterium M2-4]
MKNSAWNRKSFLSAAVFIALMTSFGSASAADVQTKDVVVTANKTEMKVRTSPAAVEIITEKEIKTLGFNDVRSVLAYASNIDLSRAVMTGNAVRIRGMNSDHTLILVDGRRMAGEDTRSTANSYALQRLSVNDIERIEIVRGPSSALYGSDAIGGVINIITKVPTKMGITMGINTGTYNTATFLHANLGKHGRWTTAFDARLDGKRKILHYVYSGGHMGTPHGGHMGTSQGGHMGTPQGGHTGTPQGGHMGTPQGGHMGTPQGGHMGTPQGGHMGTPHGGPMEEWGSITDGYESNMYGMHRLFHGTAIYDFENNNKNKIRFDIFHMNDDFQAEYPNMTSLSKRIFYNKDKKEWYHYDKNEYSIEYIGKNEKNSYQIRTYYSRLNKESNLINKRETFSEDLEKKIGGKHPKADMDSAVYINWIVEGKNTAYIGEHHNVTYGAEYRNVFYEGTRLGGSPAGLNKVKKAHSVKSYAGFVEDVWQVTDRLVFIPAIRYEYNERFGSEITPKIGMTYELEPHVRLKVNYGKGYKAPTISELYMDMNRAMGPAIVSIKGNPNLKPEYATSYDITLEGEQGNLFTKVTYFNNSVYNLIDAKTTKYGPYGMPGLIEYFNVGEVQINGTEFTLGVHFNPRVTLKAVYNTINATDKKTNARLSGRPEAVTTVQLTYDDHRAAGIMAVLSDRFTSNYYQNKKNHSYNIMDFVLEKKWSKDFATIFGVDNILNKKEPVMAIDGREWRVSGQWKF